MPWCPLLHASEMTGIRVEIRANAWGKVKKYPQVHRGPSRLLAVASGEMKPIRLKCLKMVNLSISKVRKILTSCQERMARRENYISNF